MKALLDLPWGNIGRIREEILKLSVGEIKRETLKADEEGVNLRQMTPFAGALDQEERLTALSKARFLAGGSDRARPVPQ